MKVGKRYSMPDFNSVLAPVKDWYESKRNAAGNVNTNVMTVGLILARKVRQGLPLTSARVKTPNGSQVSGLSGKAIAKILREYNEFRPSPAEGGRTSRGTLDHALELMDIINTSAKGISVDDVPDLAHQLEEFFFDCLERDYMDRQTLEVEIDWTRPVPAMVSDILEAASQRADKPTGTVLQHLVGAKLQMRFPDEQIGMDNANAADQQTSRQGDFEIGNTAFHVTMAPMEKLIDRCRSNIRDHYRPVIVTPRGKMAGAWVLADNEALGDKVEVVGAEDWIGMNIQEMSVFDEDSIKANIISLIREYNRRIRLSESDQSLQVEEPKWFGEAAD